MWFEGRAITYAELDRWIGALAGWLVAGHGVKRGDRVAVLAYNAPHTMALLFACARLGAILVPLNWRLAPAELAYILADAEPRLLLAGEAFAETAQEIAARAGGIAAVLLDEIGAECCGGDEVLPADAAGHITDPLLLVYTSGTTGRPKGAILDQNALFHNALMSLHAHRLTAADKVLVVLPLFHVGALNIAFTPALYAGAETVLLPRFEPDATFDALAAHAPTHLVIVPAVMDALIQHRRWSDADWSSLRMLTTGSSVVPVRLIEAFEARGVPVIQVYGSTETSPIAAYQRPGEGRTHPASTGRAGLHCEVRIADNDGNAIEAPGIDGEIEVRGPNVTRGYWRDATQTALAFRPGGWFRTGDVGHLDADGYLYFQDRLKRMIVSGGENIYSAEVERAIESCDKIAETCVVGLEDPHWGEVPVAAVVVKAGEEVTAAALRDHVATRIARFKVPKRVVFFQALPRNAMGKIVADEVRRLLVDRLAQ